MALSKLRLSDETMEAIRQGAESRQLARDSQSEEDYDLELPSENTEDIDERMRTYQDSVESDEELPGSQHHEHESRLIRSNEPEDMDDGDVDPGLESVLSTLAEVIDKKPITLVQMLETINKMFMVIDMVSDEEFVAIQGLLDNVGHRCWSKMDDEDEEWEDVFGDGQSLVNQWDRFLVRALYQDGSRWAQLSYIKKDWLLDHFRKVREDASRVDKKEPKAH